jgi:hypothetical protein
MGRILCQWIVTDASLAPQAKGIYHPRRRIQAERPVNGHSMGGRMMPIKAFLGALGLALIWAGPAAAAEIKVLSSNATKTLLEEIAPMFERASGHKVTLGFGTSQQVAKRMDAGETADLVVITPEAIEQLTKQGKVMPGTQVEIARSLVGIAVKRGAPKPAIGTPDAAQDAARGEIRDLLRSEDRRHQRRSHRQDVRAARHRRSDDAEVCARRRQLHRPDRGARRSRDGDPADQR